MRCGIPGSSDGVVRVFTKDPARFADEAMIKAFEEDVQKMQAASQQEIGGFKLSEYVKFILNVFEIIIINTKMEQSRRKISSIRLSSNQHLVPQRGFAN